MIAELAYGFKWAPDFWRHMGWRQFKGWLRQLNRIHAKEAGRNKTDPNSWDGEYEDAWWAEQRAERKRLRGY